MLFSSRVAIHVCMSMAEHINIFPHQQSSGMEGWTWRVCVAGWPVAGCNAHVWHNLRQKEIGLITGVKREMGEGRRGAVGEKTHCPVICAFSVPTASVMGVKTTAECSEGGGKVG